MGAWGWFSWLGETKSKLEAIKEMSKDEDVIKAVDELIAEIEKKEEKE